MTLCLEIQYVEPFTNTLQYKKEQRIKVSDLQICNLPHDYFMGKQPKPSSPNLEMSILTEVNGKIYRKQISNSDNFKERIDPVQIQRAFQDLFFCQTIRSISITNLDKSVPLRLMIDGNVANRVDKIKISPAFSKDGYPISIPIQCFMSI